VVEIRTELSAGIVFGVTAALAALAVKQHVLLLKQRERDVCISVKHGLVLHADPFLHRKAVF